MLLKKVIILIFRNLGLVAKVGTLYTGASKLKRKSKSYENI